MLKSIEKSFICSNYSFSITNISNYTSKDSEYSQSKFGLIHCFTNKDKTIKKSTAANMESLACTAPARWMSKWRGHSTLNGIIIIIIFFFFFKVDFYITFCNCKKPIDVNLSIKLEKNSDTKRFADSSL